jgi:hypothetical protein
MDSAPPGWVMRRVGTAAARVLRAPQGCTASICHSSTCECPGHEGVAERRYFGAYHPPPHTYFVLRQGVPNLGAKVVAGLKPPLCRNRSLLVGFKGQTRRCYRAF